MKKSMMFPTAWGSSDLDYPGYHDNGTFLDGLKPVVFLGRLFGVLPRNDILSRQGTQRRISFSLLCSGFLAIFFFLNAILVVFSYISSLKTLKGSEKLANFGSVFYSWTMFFVYAYFLVAPKRFRNFVLKFVAQGEQTSQFSTKFPKAYVRFCWIVCFVCMFFGITENVLYDLQSITKRGKVDSPFYLYYKQNLEHWAIFVPYDPVLTFFLVLIIKFGTWGWVFGDIIPIVMSKALTYKLEMMNTEIKEKLSLGLMPAKLNASGFTKFRNLSRTDGFLRILPFVFVYLSTLLVTECSAGFFFNFNPRKSQQDNVPAANRRSDTNGGFLDRLAPAETLWIGSNKINWSPLPLFLQFANPDQYKQQQLQKQQQQQAQARKFNFGPFQQNHVKDPFNTNQKFLFPFPQSISAGFPPPPPPPQANPISSTPFPPPAFSSPFPHVSFSSPFPSFAEARSSIQPPTEDSYTATTKYYRTTPLPLVSSPSLADSIFPRDTSSPASISLSTPSDNLNPIIAQLRKMTQWSKSKQKTFVKKEGKYGHGQSQSHGHGNHGRYNLKQKNRKKNKDRSNIEAIILADDDDQDAELPTLKRVQKHKRKSINSKEVVAPSDLVIAHPTNSAYLIDPMEVQPTALKKYQINRKDKKLGMFRSEDAFERPAPVSFKFGPQDAKPSPYRN
ncbi:unnamed protein product [Orchesella dallaii]|uniref:Uncharacterized protein n=1 Tax=Orchesella dallaii TaxID=48710 RepID=A0ABP1PP47_9HEXA